MNPVSYTHLLSLLQLYGQDVPGKMVQLQKTKKEFEGHLTLVVFPFLKMAEDVYKRQVMVRWSGKTAYAGGQDYESDRFGSHFVGAAWVGTYCIYV